MSELIRINSISEAHRNMGLPKPKHPLISIFRHKDMQASYQLDVRITSSLYFISMKDGIKGSFAYGRNAYDFEEGTLVFMAPEQVMTPVETDPEADNRGWILLFHPDLIRKFELGRNIDNYTFFNYDVHEALHLSEREKQSLKELVQKIEMEIDQNMDKHSQKLIVTNLELMLDYCKRYYDRQFYTRSNINKDVHALFEDFLKEYFRSERQLEDGIPTVKYCSQQLNMSTNYLSDLLKKETGRNAQDHIHSFIIEKAKTRLLSSNDTISQIAYGLGFEYSQHFSKIFKAKTGMSPKVYRTLN